MLGGAGAGDLRDPAHCRIIVAKAMEAFGPADMLVNNAAFQMTRDSLEIRPTRNGTARCRPTSPHVPSLQGGMQHMPAGSSIVNTASINSDTPKPKLLAYSARKVAIVNFTGDLDQLLADHGVRANSVAPGPIWAPLIPATMPPEQVETFDQKAPLKRYGQPAEFAPVYVLQASGNSSYIPGSRIAVMGGTRVI